MSLGNIEHPRLRRDMRDALKRHILHQRQKNVHQQRRKVEKAKALSSSKVQFDDNAKDIRRLERTLVDLEQQKIEQYKLLKCALTEEDQRKYSQEILLKQPSWTSLYSPNLHSTRQYFSPPQSHRLLPSQPSSFIPTVNVNAKRVRSPGLAHVYSTHVQRIYPSSLQNPSVLFGPPTSAPYASRMPHDSYSLPFPPQSIAAFRRNV